MERIFLKEQEYQQEEYGKNNLKEQYTAVGWQEQFKGAGGVCQE